nr:site-specific integrase [Thermodesulfobacterium sp.]
MWYKSTREFNSYKRHEASSRVILQFFGKDFPVEESSNGKVEEYKLWRLSQGVSPVTINKELRFLSTMINRAVDFEWIPEHKLYKKPILIKGVETKRLRYLTEEEEKRLMKAITDPLLRDIVVFALNTGMRKCEVLNLKWKNVDFQSRTVILEPHETKNKRRHVVPLNRQAWEVIKRRLKEKVISCEYVFHRNGRKIYSIRRAFESALKRAGIEDFHFHDLRHTFASRLVQKGVDLYVVKELLNHAEITTTQRYAHLRLDNLRKAVEKLQI